MDTVNSMNPNTKKLNFNYVEKPPYAKNIYRNETGFNFRQTTANSLARTMAYWPGEPIRRPDNNYKNNNHY